MQDETTPDILAELGRRYDGFIFIGYKPAHTVGAEKEIQTVWKGPHPLAFGMLEYGRMNVMKEMMK